MEHSAVPNRRVPSFVIFEKKAPSKDVYYQHPRLATFTIFGRDTHDDTDANLEILCWNSEFQLSDAVIVIDLHLQCIDYR